MDKQRFQRSLLNWYDSSKRTLPWRDNPNPYHVWISEIMLQQTRVEAVIPYFNQFIQTFPTIQSVAEAEDDVLNKLWEGLGYYSRVRNIKKAAIQIVNEFNGELPRTRKELESLSGIGPYTAGAILSIAFNIPDTAVDGNVLRVFARLTANQNSIKDPKEKAKIRSMVASLLPDKRVGDFNQGLMEIGATVCLPNGVPKCVLCPFNQMCEAFEQGLTKTIPKKQEKKARRVEKRTVLIIEYNHKVVVKKRSEQGLLAGLYEFPNELGHLTKAEIIKRYPDAVIQKLPKSKHVFSHLEWHMVGYRIVLSKPPSEELLATTEEIRSVYSIPTAFKQYRLTLINEH